MTVWVVISVNTNRIVAFFEGKDEEAQSLAKKQANDVEKLTGAKCAIRKLKQGWKVVDWNGSGPLVE